MLCKFKDAWKRGGFFLALRGVDLGAVWCCASEYD